MADEANRGVLVAEARRGIELIEHITPLVRGIQSRVDDREIADLPLEPQRAQPVLVLLRQLVAGPVHRLLGERVEAFLHADHRGLFVVVSFDDRTVERAHNVEAFLGEGVVADDISHADKVGAFLRFRIGENRLQSMKIGVNVAEYGKSHGRVFRPPGKRSGFFYPFGGWNIQFLFHFAKNINERRQALLVAFEVKFLQ